MLEWGVMLSRDQIGTDFWARRRQMSWQPIVVGVDASPEAAGAAVFACRMAERTGTSCQLVHATPDVLASADVPGNDPYRRVMLEEARTSILAALAEAVPVRLLDTLTVRLGGAPVVLQRVAAERGAELIVLGGKHHSALGRWFGGSTSLNAARSTEVPMLVTAGAPSAIHRVFVAVDISGAARPTLAAAERYAAMYGAELRALSVLEPLPVIPGVAPLYETSEFYAMSEELVQRDIWSLIRTPDVEKLVRYGGAVETILREALAWRADLLVVGSHGKGWAERLLVGSVTERLLNHLPTSLLVVPTPRAAVPEPVAAAVAAAMA
jgi:nucleotide-binding universal stress UspA family protein